MAAPILLSPPNTFHPHKLKKQTFLSSPTKPPKSRIIAPINRTQTLKNPIICAIFKNHKVIATILGAGLAVSAIVSPASAAELPLLGSSLQLSEPSNALSLPTWAIHVSSVVEWSPCLVELFVPALGTSFITLNPLRVLIPSRDMPQLPKLFYFTYKGRSFVPCMTTLCIYDLGDYVMMLASPIYVTRLLVLVALQGALTVIGNTTMCVAAFRIYKSLQGRSENL
ncbi:hypothetical protein RJ639_010427 [Escallonia herrerae]|uniref:Uncharacterized protein n=1 Tax=Escallonia herrerae TaxID=1293975 RepID=A0AA88VQ20_9ASTE|nr:hypothetical protein RJ639_010427 [Escallonia herrerae]